MLRFIVCGLLAGLLAVSARSLDGIKLPVSTIISEPIPFEDVIKDSEINHFIYLLSNCDYQYPQMKFFLNLAEVALMILMERKNFSQHTENIMSITYLTRNLMCPPPPSYLKASTPTSSDNEVPVTQQYNEPNAQEPSYNIPEPTKSFDPIDRSSDSRLGQSIESFYNNYKVPAPRQSDGPNTQESSENIEKPIAEYEYQQY